MRTATGIERVVDRVAREVQLQVDIVTRTVLHQEIIPILHRIELIVQGSHELEVVIRPVQSLAITCRHTKHRDVLIGVVGILIGIIHAVMIAIVVAIATIVATIVKGVVAIGIVAQIAVRNVGLLREIGTDGKRIGTFASKPRIHEGDTIGLIVTSVGLTTQRQGLTLTLRDDTLVGARVQEILHGEVGELQAQLTDHTRLSPTGGELDLVVRLRDQVILNIYRTIFRIRQGHGIHVLRVEVSHLSQLTYGTYQVLSTEKHTRLRAQLTTDNILIQSVVPLDNDLVDGCLRAFLDTDLQSD